MTTTRTRRCPLWVACALAVACALVAGAPPARAVRDPVPISSQAPTPPPEGGLLPDDTVEMEIEVLRYQDTSSGEKLDGVELSVKVMVDTHDRRDLSVQECQLIADTFWSGSHPDFQATAEVYLTNCYLKAYYYREARHAFYSLDEAGHVQLRAPMQYLHQMAAGFANATITSLHYVSPPIRNTHCNANPHFAELDAPSPYDTHRSRCDWRTSKGAVIPTTDDPLMEGDAEDFFININDATVGPFTDLVAPTNPYTVTPTTEPAQDPSATAGQDTDTPASNSSTGVLIGVGAAITLLLLTAAAALVVALRRT